MARRGWEVNWEIIKKMTLFSLFFLGDEWRRLGQSKLGSTATTSAAAFASV